MILSRTMNSYIFAALVCLLVFVKEGLAINCYQCESTDHPDCKENFESDFGSITIEPTECTVDAAQYCIKTTGVWGGVVGTTRFCSSRDMGDQCQFIRYPDHDRVYRACIYTCGTNGCNSASALTLSRLTMFVPLVGTLMMLVRKML